MEEKETLLFPEFQGNLDLQCAKTHNLIQWTIVAHMSHDWKGARSWGFKKRPEILLSKIKEDRETSTDIP